jgi:hypothetical protein
MKKKLSPYSRTPCIRGIPRICSRLLLYGENPKDFLIWKKYRIHTNSTPSYYFLAGQFGGSSNQIFLIQDPLSLPLYSIKRGLLFKFSKGVFYWRTVHYWSVICLRYAVWSSSNIDLHHTRVVSNWNFPNSNQLDLKKFQIESVKKTIWVFVFQKYSKFWSVVSLY